MDASIPELLASGVKLMLIGMGIVFLFLLLLVGVIQQSHRIMKRLEDQSSASGPAAAADVGGTDDGELVAVIAAAIHRYEQP